MVVGLTMCARREHDSHVADTKWDKPRDLLEDMLRQASELTVAWPSIPERSVREYYDRELGRARDSLAALRQAACAGQDMERIHQQREAQLWAEQDAQ